MLGVTALTGVVAGGSRQAGLVKVPVNLRSLVRDRPFYVAHRGGGHWLEMTAYTYAYEQGTRLAGLAAMKLSLCLSKDDVLVCSHDRDTKRLTGQPHVIADETWATLSTVKVSARETTDPKQAAQPLNRFAEAISLIINDYVLFVEPRVSAAAAPLLHKLVGLEQPERIVWKQPVNPRLFAEAKAYGFGTWGYVLNEPAHFGENLTRLAADPNVDMLGAPLAGSDAIISAVVSAAPANGKPVIARSLRSSTDRDWAIRPKCGGPMTSTIAQLWATHGDAPVQNR